MAKSRNPLAVLSRILTLIVCANSMLVAYMADQVSSPTKPIVLHINITTVNVTWSWQGHGDVQFLVQVSGPKEIFVNASQPTDNYYLIYGNLSVTGVYIFQVLAYQNGISSPPSPQSDLLINGVNAPSGPPENLRATAVSTSQVALSWDPPSLTAAFPYHYSIYYDVHDDPWHMSMASGCIECETGAQEATISHLKPGTTYYFTVVADLSGQLSVFSKVASATTHSSSLPPVSLLSVLSVTYASVTLSWRAPEVDGFVDDYTVCYTPTVLAAPTETLQDCTSSYPSQHYITSGNNATVSGLEQGVEYLFLVQYSYQNRLGNVSAPLNATTNSSLHCQLCQPQGPHSLLLQWMVDNSSAHLQTFLVSLGDAGAVVKTVESGLEVVSTVLDGLMPFTLYTASVALDSRFGEAVLWVQCPPCWTGESVPTGPPQNVAATALSSSTVRLTWEPPLPDEQNGLIEFYQVLYKACNSSLVATLEVDTGLAVDIDGLEADTVYCFEVAAKTSVGIGPLSTPSVKCQTPEGLPTGPPTNIRSVAATDTSLSLAWDLPLAEERNGVIVAYTLRYAPITDKEPKADTASEPATSSHMAVSGRGSPSLPEAQANESSLTENYTEVNVSSCSVTLLRLSPETTYGVRIAASTAVGRGPWSDVESFSTLESSNQSCTSGNCLPLVSVVITILDHWTVDCTTTALLAWDITTTEGLLLQNLTLRYSDTVLVLNTAATSINVTLDQPSVNYTLTLTAYLELQDGSSLQNSSSTSIATTGCSTTLSMVTVILIVLLSVIGVALMVVLCTGCVSLCVVKYKKSSQRRRFSLLFNNFPMSSPNAYVTSGSNFPLPRGDGRSSTSGSSISDDASSRNATYQHTLGYSDSLDSTPNDEDQEAPLLPDLRPPVPVHRPIALSIGDYLDFPAINGNSFTYSSASGASSSSSSFSFVPVEDTRDETEDTSETIPDRDAPEGSSLASTSNVNVMNMIV